MNKPAEHDPGAAGSLVSAVVVDNWTSATTPPTGDAYTELLAVPALSVGRFTASPGYEDVQPPHIEDEVYFVTTGAAELLIGDHRHPMTAGSIAYIPAGTSHRFTNVTQAVEVLVFFAPCPPRRDEMGGGSAPPQT